VPKLGFSRKVAVPIQVKTVHGFSKPESKKCGRFTKKLLEQYVGCVFLLYDYEPEVEGKHWYFASDARSLLKYVREGKKSIQLDPRLPTGKKIWNDDFGGAFTTEQLRRKLEAHVRHAKTRTYTYADLFKTTEAREQITLQRLLGDSGKLAVTPAPQQTVDFEVVFPDGTRVRVQGKGREKADKTGLQHVFFMEDTYTHFNLDAFMLTIWHGGKIAGFFLVPRQLLWRHRFYRGQESSRNRVTGAPIRRETMGDIAVRSIEDILPLPGLRSYDERDIAHSRGDDATRRAFMKEMAKYYFEVEFGRDGAAPSLVPASKTDDPLDRLREALRRGATQPYDSLGLVELPEIKLTLGMLSDAKLTPGDAYIIGTKHGTYDGECCDVLERLRGWSVGVRDTAAHGLTFGFFPPGKYFWKGRASFAAFMQNGYTEVPDTALELADAYENPKHGGDDDARRAAALEVFGRTKPDHVERLEAFCEKQSAMAGVAAAKTDIVNKLTAAGLEPGADYVIGTKSGKYNGKCDGFEQLRGWSVRVRNTAKGLKFYFHPPGKYFFSGGASCALYETLDRRGYTEVFAAALELADAWEKPRGEAQKHAAVMAIFCRTKKRLVADLRGREDFLGRKLSAAAGAAKKPAKAKPAKAKPAKAKPAVAKPAKSKPAKTRGRLMQKKGWR